MDPAALPASPAPRLSATSILADRRRMVGRHFYTYTRVRALVAVIIVAAALFARHILGMETLRVREFVLLAGTIALYDAIAWALFRRYRDPASPDVAYDRLLGVSYAAVVLDFLAITFALWLVGGGRSPFVAFYLLHVIVGCVLFSRRAALTLTALAYALLLLLVGVEWSGAAAPPFPEGAVAGEGPLGDVHALTLVVVYGMLFSFSAYVTLELSRSFGRLQRRVLLAHDELERLSEQRKNFLHIALHNIKAPIGAATMLLDNLRAGLAGDTTEKQREWIDRSRQRLDDLTSFVADLQTLSSLESDIIQSVFTPVDLVPVARALVAEYRDIAEARAQTLTVEVRGPIPPVLGFERLLREALVNYITNAIAYTPEGGSITVRLRARGSTVRIEVIDTGIGIAPEDLGRLFREFVRIPGKDPGAKPVKGTGLGLSIVKRVAAAHGGRVGVESEPGKGSTFFVDLPALED